MNPYPFRKGYSETPGSKETFLNLLISVTKATET